MACLVALAWYWPFDRDRGFVAHPLPLQSADRLFDIGVVDADGDGQMDVYTSNHHFRQVLWLGDGKGGFRDVLGDWRLDQSRDFPLAELTFAAPVRSLPGVYVFWLGTQFVIQAHRGADLGAWRGTMRVLDPVRIASSEGFDVNKTDIRAGQREGAELTFSAAGDGRLVLVPGGQGLPLEFQFEGSLRPDQIFVGLGRVSPSTTSFALAMRDRHGHAWADINDDGVLDVFISRGALGGRLLELPPAVREGLRDELLVTDGVGSFSDVTVEAGIEKRGCSGRHASWVDVDGDGVLELFVNCYDREAVAGDYPKQLYRRVGPMRFEEVAQSFGLGLPDQQMGSYAWFDVDDDGDVDLLAFQDEGLFLYRNVGRRFERELVQALESSQAEKIGHTQGNNWFYDGKISVGDLDGDGDFDAFMSSKRGQVLLRNEGGRLEPVKPIDVGLPAESLTAVLVDYDNDGRLDVHLVPHGLYRQRPDGRFERTGLLAFDPAEYQAALVNWLDIDGDGRPDVLFALNPDPKFRHWWQFGERKVRGSQWQLSAYRNTIAAPSWLAVDLIGTPGNRQGIGAVVTVTAGGATQSRIAGAAEGAFFSQGHYRTYFGLGNMQRVDAVRVLWSDGATQDLGAVDAGQVLKVQRR
jgi:hypothetical protein